MRTSAAAVPLLVALAIPLPGCLPGEQSAPAARSMCLAPAEPAGGRPAVIALLGDIDPRTGAIQAPGTRLVRFSLPGGRIEARRSVRGGGGGSVASLDALRLNSRSGPLLAATRDGGSVHALIRPPSGTRARVAVIDPASLRLRCSLPLQRGVRYSGLLVGRSRAYAFGVRRVQRGLWDAVVTVRELRPGGPIRTHTLRQAVRARMSKDWFSYSGALSDDERRLVLSYHGGDTTGADLFRVSSGAGISPAALADRPGRTDIGWAHGGVAPVGRRFLAATGSDRLLEFHRNARVTRRLPVRAEKMHLMDFAVDPDRRLVYLSSCGLRPAIQRLDLADGSRDTISSGNVCGSALAVHGDRYLVLDATEVSRLGYPRTSPDGLRILDLRSPGPGRRIALPRSVRALDAEVVRVP